MQRADGAGKEGQDETTRCVVGVVLCVHGLCVPTVRSIFIFSTHDGYRRRRGQLLRRRLGGAQCWAASRNESPPPPVAASANVGTSAPSEPRRHHRCHCSAVGGVAQKRRGEGAMRSTARRSGRGCTSARGVPERPTRRGDTVGKLPQPAANAAAAAAARPEPTLCWDASSRRSNIAAAGWGGWGAGAAVVTAAAGNGTDAVSRESGKRTPQASRKRKQGACSASEGVGQIDFG